jgi:maleylpyruvate isomerase
MRAAHERLFSAVDQPDEWARQPSGLPGWTRAHVVAHLLGNALGLRRLTEWAASGEETPMYDSPAARAAEIEDKSGWRLATLRGDLMEESARLESALQALTHPLGANTLVMGSGAQIDAWELPMMRIREVEIHHVDLAAGYTADHWSEPFTFRTMNQVVPTFVARGTLPVSALLATDTGRVWAPGHSGLAEGANAAAGPEIVGSQGQLLAWLVGRPHHDVRCRDGSPAPEAPRWS